MNYGAAATSQLSWISVRTEASLAPAHIPLSTINTPQLFLS